MQNQIGLVNTAGQCFAARFHIQRGAERLVEIVGGSSLHAGVG
jgi:hypothetical protein